MKCFLNDFINIILKPKPETDTLRKEVMLVFVMNTPNRILAYKNIK